MTSLHVICGLGPPPIKNPGYAYATAYRVGMSLGFVLCLYFDDCFPQICFFYICLPLFHPLTERPKPFLV